jgi:phosphatidylglycerol:prolipoprotein diacylglycerol transferase
MVMGFLSGLWLVRRASRRAGLDPETMSDVALYALILGVVGARTFFVLHHLDQFSGDVLGVFAIWRGGLEFLGGVGPAVAFLLFYLHRRKLPMRRYLDILALGLMMGLAFGRVGCFLNGCCFGGPTDLPWGLRFPYRSYAYNSQINPDPRRDRTEPYLPVPPHEYAEFFTEDGRWYPKPFEELTAEQQHAVTHGEYRCLPIHPTQLYASAHAFLLCGVLYLLWRRTIGDAAAEGRSGWSRRPGVVTAGLCILYGPGRFVLEAIRDDNPYEFATLTISQIMGIVMFIAGLVLLGVQVTQKPRGTRAGACAEMSDATGAADGAVPGRPEPGAG